MKLGIFAKTFRRGTIDETLDAVVEHGLNQVQFNMLCAGLPTLPERIDPAVCARIRNGFDARGLVMSAISGTFNMIHPDAGQRAEGFKRLVVLAGSARAMGTGVITLCTGTRNPKNMWASHPENESGEAWDELLGAIEKGLIIAEKEDVILGVEPEISNVMSTALKARRLLDHFDSPRLKVVMDAANLFGAGQLPRMREIITEAFDLLGSDIILAHAKDLGSDGAAGHEAAGTGVLDYDLYLDELHRAGFGGALILHGLSESQVPFSASFLRQKLAAREESSIAAVK